MNRRYATCVLGLAVLAVAPIGGLPGSLGGLGITDAMAGEGPACGQDGKWIKVKKGGLTHRDRWELRKTKCDADGNEVGYTLYVYWPDKSGFSKDHWAVYEWAYREDNKGVSKLMKVRNDTGTLSDFPNDFPERPK